MINSSAMQVSCVRNEVTYASYSHKTVPESDKHRSSSVSKYIESGIELSVIAITTIFAREQRTAVA